MTAETRARLFRQHDAEEGTKVTYVELFFDLVFVYAIAQLAYRLVEHLTWIGAVETGVLFLAVWWLWIFTSWATNWLDPDREIVRMVLIIMMAGGLALSAAIPYAFDKYGLLFAGTYVTMQVFRTFVVIWASWGHDRQRMRNFLRILFYFGMGAPLWFAGALSDPTTRLWLWSGAVAIEYLGPFLLFRTPFLGRSTSKDWDISGKHMAERCALFIIIALGEAILVAGTTFGDLKPDPPTVWAFAVTFVTSAAMWWIYFHTGAQRGTDALEEDNTGRIARDAYTYLHMPIVAGILLTAVASKLMMTYPYRPVTTTFLLLCCGGALVFLIGNQLFKWITAERPYPPLSHFVGFALLIGIIACAYVLSWPPLGVGTAVAGALMLTAIWEWFALSGGWRRWTPWIGRRAAIAMENSER